MVKPDDLGSVIELALRAVFDLCVPAASGGARVQTFPADLIVELSEEQKREFEEVLEGDTRLIKCEDGPILFQISAPYFRIITADGDPRDAESEFEKMLLGYGGHIETLAEPPGGCSSKIGVIQLSTAEAVWINMTIRLDENASGFFVSTCRVVKVQ